MADYDLICLGGGNAGQAAAGIAREAGWKVLVIETREMGGTCPLRGCVPKKVLVAAAETLDTIARAGIHKITVGEPALDWPALMGRKQGFVEGVPESFEQSLTERGIDVVYGKGRFVDEHTVEVDGKRYTGRKILVAEVGGWYDCGKLETLLETNEILLAAGAARRQDFPGVTIHDPVYIEDGVTIERSEIGPGVSIEAGTTITDSTVRNSIIGRDSRLTGVRLDGAMLGNRVEATGISGSASLGDDCLVRGDRA